MDFPIIFFSWSVKLKSHERNKMKKLYGFEIASRNVV